MINSKDKFRSGLYVFLIAMLVNIVSCTTSENKIDNFAQLLFTRLACPEVDPMFGSVSLCMKSYDISEIITLTMTIPSEPKSLLPLKQWQENGTLKLFLKEIVCKGTSVALGINEESILSNNAGILQTIQKPNSGQLVIEEYSEDFRKEFAKRVRVIVDIPFLNENYKITRWAYIEANQVPEKCTVESTKDWGPKIGVRSSF